MNDLEVYFNNNTGRLIHKWHHYFEIYDRHFNNFRNKEISILEIGVAHGGSLQMWKSYFGPKAKIYGVDINPGCKQFEEENIEIFIGNQADILFLEDLKTKIPPIDILIDDGGHFMSQQLTTFNILFDHVKENGIYLCEDTHTSYLLNFGGGYKRKGTFVEFSKDLVDNLQSFFSEQKSFKPSNFSYSIDSVHFYTNIVVIEKKVRNTPYNLKSGNPSFFEIENIKKNKSYFRRLLTKQKQRGIKYFNLFLRYLRLPGYIWK